MAKDGIPSSAPGKDYPLREEVPFKTDFFNCLTCILILLLGCGVVAAFWVGADMVLLYAFYMPGIIAEFSGIQGGSGGFIAAPSGIQWFFGSIVIAAVIMLVSLAAAAGVRKWRSRDR